MPVTGFLKIGDIAGESQRFDHEDEIDIHDIMWTIAQDSSAQRESGRRRTRAKVGALKVKKFVDAASPYLLLACMQGKGFPEMRLSIRTDGGETRLDYLVITMENVTISRFKTIGTGDDKDNKAIEEVMGLIFENVTYKYTVQADDHSAGDEHETTFDIAGGA